MLFRSNATAKARGDVVEEHFKEAWEFTSNQVHRAVWEYDDTKKEGRYKRLESRAFDSKNLCNELLDGKALEIDREGGTGKRVMFVGTPYLFGGRSIEVELNGKTLLDLHEACTSYGYRESNARAFATLYEKLASQARARFKDKTETTR